MNKTKFTSETDLRLVSFQNGQILVLAVVILTLVLITTLGLISGSLTYFQSSKYSIESSQAENLAEAGIDKAVAALNESGGTYNGEDETLLGGGSFSVTVADKDASTKIIESTGYIPNKSSPKAKRVVKIQISKGVGVAFNYGVQVGEGGMYMEQQSEINGGLYSNGSIQLEQQTTINGDVRVASGTQPMADQEFDCAPPDCSQYDYFFGKNIGGENRLDIAQSFKPSQTAVVNKVSLKVKKIGPGPHTSPTVKILGNTVGNNPNKNNLIATGTLISSQVTGNYNFVDVGFTTSPLLTAGTYYWIVVDTSSNSANYWSWSNDPLGGYTCSSTPPCYAKFSPNHVASNPTWTNIAGDLSFKVFMGGISTYIDGDGTGGNISKINGSAYANVIKDVSLTGNAYYQTVSNMTANGQNCISDPSPSKCNPNSPDQPPIPMPISEGQIEIWKGQADDNIVDVSTLPACPSSLVSGKYVGNLTLPDHCVVTVDSPVWIDGNFTMNQQSQIRLNASYGASSGIFMVSGVTSIDQQNDIFGSCHAENCVSGSHLVLNSLFSSKDDPEEDPAIIINQQGNTGILYSNNGEIVIHQQNSFTEVTAWKLYLDQQVTVNYSQGLAGAFFSSGPSGVYSVIKGTYQSK